MKWERYQVEIVSGRYEGWSSDGLERRRVSDCAERVDVERRGDLEKDEEEDRECWLRMKDRYFTYYDENMLLSKFVTRDDAYEREDFSRVLPTSYDETKRRDPLYDTVVHWISSRQICSKKDEPYNIENIFDSKPSLSLFWGGPGVVSTSHFDYHRNNMLLLFGGERFSVRTSGRLVSIQTVSYVTSSCKTRTIAFRFRRIPYTSKSCPVEAWWRTLHSPGMDTSRSKWWERHAHCFECLHLDRYAPSNEWVVCSKS